MGNMENRPRQKAILVSWGRLARPTGVQLLVFFCFSVPVVLFDPQGYPGVGCNTLFLLGSRLCFIIVFICDYLFPVMIHWWVRKPSRGPNNYMFWAVAETGAEVGIPWSRFRPPSFLVLTVPRRYICCGSLLFLVLAVHIYTLVHLLC